MLAKRIIPCLDIKNGKVVKGVRFRNLRVMGDPVEHARYYAQAGADELVFLDITATNERRDTVVELVEKLSTTLNIPFTVGGGIRTVEDIRRLLLHGADKVSINSAAVATPQLISNGAEVYGSQCVVVAIDVKKTAANQWNVFIHSGQTDTGLEAVAWAKKVAELGAGEILLTSMDCDGRQEGYDLPITSRIAAEVNIPVIASGGAGTIQHFADVFKQTYADAALAASLFHTRTLEIAALKEFLYQKEIPVRRIYAEEY